jgi:hypothetical protein
MNHFTPLTRFLQQMHNLTDVAAFAYEDALGDLELAIMQSLSAEVTDFDNRLEDVELEIKAQAEGRLSDLFAEYEEAWLDVMVDYSSKAFWAGFRLGALQERWLARPDEAFPEIGPELLLQLLQEQQ